MRTSGISSALFPARRWSCCLAAGKVEWRPRQPGDGNPPRRRSRASFDTDLSTIQERYKQRQQDIRLPRGPEPARRPLPGGAAGPMHCLYVLSLLTCFARKDFADIGSTDGQRRLLARGPMATSPRRRVIVLKAIAVSYAAMPSYIVSCAPERTCRLPYLFVAPHAMSFDSVLPTYSSPV